MFQESVYTKICRNEHICKATTKLIKNFLPPEGSIFVLAVTETQFANMDFLLGRKTNKVIDSDERIIEL